MTTSGFELVREEAVPEINVQARLYRHAKTGARLLCLDNDDENKVFSIAFSTPPEDSTGLPHILEHSVLCGSENYPVKEPFKELRKGSLNTFLNAFTAPDATAYPVASQNLADLRNLMRVYLDAVFNPFITPETLKQQGWHYVLEEPDGPLSYRGVVFNEMKGVYSSPDSLIGRYVRTSLFPDNSYGLDSGGDPSEIPDLTYEQFKRFYQRHYHPSNAFIFLYGDDHSEERFQILDEYLSAYEPSAPAPDIDLQPLWPQTRRFTHGYDAGAENGDDGSAKRSYLTLNWVLNETTDVETTLALRILSHVLVGTAASPLRKALIDSGLGEKVIGGGYDSAYRQAIFSTGLKGIDAGDAGQVEELILDTLQSLVQDGIDPDMVAASLNTVEFQLREANTGGFPRGLMYMLVALTPWQHGGDPIAHLAFEAPLESVKSSVDANPRYFEDLIDRYLLHNSHRSVILLRPDPQARQRTEAAEQRRLQEARATMAEEDLQAVRADMERLQELQDRSDSPEALATIPSLSLADLDRANKLIPIEVSEAHDASVLFHDLFTNGILYLDLGFDLRALPREYLPYAGLFGRLLLGMGTEAQDYVKLSQRIGRETGGIRASTLTRNTRSGGTATWFLLRGKATVDNAGKLLDILGDVLLTARLDYRERLRQIVLEDKASLEAGLVPSGHSFVYGRLSAGFSEAEWVGEQMDGVDYLFFLRRLAARIDQDWPSVLSDLEAVRGHLVNRQGMLCNVTVDAEAFQVLQPQLTGFLASLPASPWQPAEWLPEMAHAREGLAIPTQVNYVGQGANLYALGYQLKGSGLVAVNFLNNTWFWDKVRVQGGAYGGFCLFDNLSGVLGYLSYRDPNLLETLKVYDETADYLRRADLDWDTVEKVIIGVIGRMDTYMLPDAKGFTSMVRHLTGDSDEFRQGLRDQVLGTTAEDLRQFAGVLERAREESAVVVMGSEQAIAAANESLNPRLSLTKLM